MILNKTETKRMLKVKSALEEMFNEGKLCKYRVVPYTVKEIAMCYDGLVYDITHSTVTRDLTVKHFFEKMGFFVKESPTDNYWNIYISERMKKLCSELN